MAAPSRTPMAGADPPSRLPLSSSAPPARRRRAERGAPATPGAAPAARRVPTAADEQLFPRASAVLESLAAYASTTAAALLLLPLSARKVSRQLPRGVAALASDGARRGFVGARATLAESALRFASTALLPPPFSTLLSYVGSVPLRGAVVRAQSGTFAAARVALPRLTAPRGLAAAWRAQLLRDVPFLFIETLVLTTLVLGRARAGDEARGKEGGGGKEAGGAESAWFGRREDKAASAARPPGRRDSIQYKDAIAAGTVAGVATVPLDLLHTRMLVSGRPSAWRGGRAVVRLARQRGVLALLRARSGAGMYVAECMVKPMAQITIYTVCRAMLVSSWLSWRMNRGAPPQTWTLDRKDFEDRRELSEVQREVRALEKLGK